jgi:hypothetical protein
MMRRKEKGCGEGCFRKIECNAPAKVINRKQSKHGIKAWSKHDEHHYFDENHQIYTKIWPLYMNDDTASDGELVLR